jgi:hypothetical protein
MKTPLSLLSITALSFGSISAPAQGELKAPPSLPSGDPHLPPAGSVPIPPELAGKKRLTPYLGVVTTPVPPALAAQLGLREGFGLVVENVVPDSPASAAGVQRFDVLTKLNDQQLIEPSQLMTLVRSLAKDEEVTLTFLRKGQEQKIALKVGETPMPFIEPRYAPPSWPGIRKPNSFNPKVPDYGELRNHSRAWQEKMREFQQRMDRYHEEMRKWQKQFGGERPNPPKPPTFEPPAPYQPDDKGDKPSGLRLEPGPSPRTENRRSELLRDVRKGRMTLHDRDGEIELIIRDGQRSLIARDPEGGVVFSGDIDTARQRENIPEVFRHKLTILEAQPQPEPATAAPIPPILALPSVKIPDDLSPELLSDELEVQ